MVRRESTRREMLTIDPENYLERSYPLPRVSRLEDREPARSSKPGRRTSTKQRKSARRLRRLEPVALGFAAIIAFIGLGFSLFSGRGGADLSGRPFSTVSVTVAPGDTLWSLAQRYEDPALQPADRIGLIRQANPN